MNFSSSFLCRLLISALASLPLVAFTASANVALYKTATASTSESSNHNASKVVDGNSSTRWASSYADNNWIAVDLGTNYAIKSVVLNWEAAYASSYLVQVSSDGKNWTTAFSTQSGNGGVDTISVSKTGRYVRMYGVKRGTPWGYSLEDFEVYGSVATTSTTTTSSSKSQTAQSSSASTSQSTTNIAYKKSVLARSVLASGLEAKNITDGLTSTRWASAKTSTSWIRIDLGANYNINRVKLIWDTAYGKAYKIQSSTDGVNWTSIYATLSGDGGTDEANVSRVGRYVRMYGLLQGVVGSGYSLKEFAIYGSAATGSSSSKSSSSKSSVASSSSSKSSSSSVKSSSSSSVRSSSASSQASSSSGDSSGLVKVNGQVVLDWHTPTERENGRYLELDEIGGYEIRYKKSGDSKHSHIMVNSSSTSRYTIGYLSGSYEFSVATFDKTGLYSNFVKITPY